MKINILFFLHLAKEPVVKKLTLLPVIGLLCLSACGDLSVNKLAEKDKKESVNDGKEDHLKQDDPVRKPGESVRDLTSTSNIQELLSQDWELKSDLDDHEGQESVGHLIMPFRGIFLATDKTAVNNPRNQIGFGTWDYNEQSKQLIITYEKGGKDVYEVRSVNPTQLRVIKKNGGDNKVMLFVSDGMQHKVKEENPYYHANSRWRIPPKTAESDTAIRQRLKACVNFFRLYYNAAVERNFKQLSYYGFPSCIKFYGPGIFMIKEEDLDPRWIACFYNKEDAMKAYKIMRNTLLGHFDWPKEDIGWVRKNAAVLKQICGKL